MRFVGYIETGGKSFGIYDAPEGIIVQKSNYSSHKSEGRLTFTKQGFQEFIASLNLDQTELDQRILTLL